MLQGRNALAVVLADGWFRGQTGITRAADQWGDTAGPAGPAPPRARRRVGHRRGHRVGLEQRDRARRGRGPDRRGAVGPHPPDAGLGRSGFRRLGLGRAPLWWSTATPDSSTLRRRRYGGSRSSCPGLVSRFPDGRHVVDLGQNINGWIRLTDLGPAGTTVTLTHGEWLDADGDVTTDHLRPAVPFLPAPLPAGQVDRVVSAGVPGDAFEPRRTTHGFQYVRIEGHPGVLTVDDVRGVVVHTDLRRTGWFSCSDDRLDRLHEAAVWSLRGNVCEVPTDCPQRERAGWTGDWGLFVPTATFLYDVAGFSTKWLRDVAADQWPDGTVANMSPSTRGEGRSSPVAFLNGSAGWGDAARAGPLGAVPRLRGHRRPRPSRGRPWWPGWTGSSGWRPRPATPIASRGRRRPHPTRSTCGTPVSTGESGSSRERRSPTSRLGRRRTRATWRPPTSRTAPA